MNFRRRVGNDSNPLSHFFLRIRLDLSFRGESRLNSWGQTVPVTLLMLHPGCFWDGRRGAIRACSLQFSAPEFWYRALGHL
jgi:hypothetical protein